MSLILVSNRVARPNANEPINGGLAAALLPAVTASGAIWVGSSGRFLENAEKREPFAQIEALGTGALATVDLPGPQYRGFYQGFANSALWPVLHSRTDLIRTSAEDYASYCEINAIMARALLRFAKPDAMFWIHDYHFMMLAADLRRLGIEQPVGFFLHTPFPARHTLVSLPHHRELVQAMLAYDLIGFQTDEDRANFADYLVHELGLSLRAGAVATERGTTRLATFPIGIDARAFADRAARSVNRAEVARLRSSLLGARLVIGVDRLDYSKGLETRFRAFDLALQNDPALKRTVRLLQIAVLSRSQIGAYRQLQRELAALVGEINGRHAEVDWTPIRYLNRGFGQSVLAGFYRTARVGLVTPLRDGMNLVAKEYVAAQDPSDPGVLVLSQFAGAARQLDAALLVNPHDVEAMARAIKAALVMPLDERRDRWGAMMGVLEASSLTHWFSTYVAALKASGDAARAPDRRNVARPAFRRLQMEPAAAPAL
ncbi:MAG TPA: trehalose-6-phosphate synthase [Xanthobacteraceae bacterium]|nr:trehalose-6-phosphate synthase [Xanthobacteraceae bacterium]